MNKYSIKFELSCPNNDQRIAYQASIETDRTIMAENLYGYFASLASAFHEDLADQAYERFGGRQTIRAHHHGVDIETVRGDQ